MYKGLVFVVLLGLLHLSSQSEQCAAGPPDCIEKLQWPDMHADCVNLVKGHIKAELGASMTYLSMWQYYMNAAHFRPGFAAMVLKHAGEERDHAIGLMEYLLMRGYNISKEDIPTLKPEAVEWDSVFQALSTTLTIETNVRDAFKNIIYTCEGEADAEHKAVDYHISDFLTANFLEEQHHGVREISLLLTTLGRMLQCKGNHAFAEWEFDKTLLKD